MLGACSPPAVYKKGPWVFLRQSTVLFLPFSFFFPGLKTKLKLSKMEACDVLEHGSIDFSLENFIIPGMITYDIAQIKI